MDLQNKDAQFNIEWKIRNFDDFPREKGQLLWSPTLDIDTLHNSQWILHLYPDGDNDGNGMHTSLYLIRKFDDDYPEDIVLQCQLSFLVPEKKADIAPVSWKTKNHIFRKGGRCGSQEFLEKGKIVSYLDNNTLTVICRISLNGVDSCRSGECVAISIIGTDIRTFDWIIENFDDLQPGDQRVVSVKSASKDAHPMTMTLSLTSEYKLMVDISPEDRKRIKRAYCSLDTEKGERHVQCGGNEVWFNDIKAGQNWSFPLSCSKQVLSEKLTNNSLHLECYFIFYLGVEFEKVERTDFKPLTSNPAPQDGTCNIL